MKNEKYPSRVMTKEEIQALPKLKGYEGKKSIITIKENTKFPKAPKYIAEYTEPLTGEINGKSFDNDLDILRQRVENQKDYNDINGIITTIVDETV